MNLAVILIKHKEEYKGLILDADKNHIVLKVTKDTLLIPFSDISSITMLNLEGRNNIGKRKY